MAVTLSQTAFKSAEVTKFTETKKALQGHSSVKTMLIVHREFVPAEETVNQQVYLNVLKRLHESL